MIRSGASIRWLLATGILVASSSIAGAVPATSAATQPKPGTVTRLSYGSGQHQHPYLVYTPKGYQPSQHLPLLVMLHGCQTTAYQQMKANRYNPLADREHFVVAYPDIDPAEAAQPGPLRNCFQFFNSENFTRGKADGAAIAAITRHIISAWRIDRQRVYLMGMSAGSFLTADMAATYPDLYAAVGENAGGAFSDFSCVAQSVASLPVATSAKDAYAAMGRRARVVPKIVIGGDSDHGIPPACADKALAQSLRTNNLVLSHHSSQTAPIRLAPQRVRHRQVKGGRSYTIADYHDARGCLIAQRYLVNGMDHFWSGGSANPKWAGFTDPTGPSAAVASWKFFEHFTKRDTAQSC